MTSYKNRASFKSTLYMKTSNSYYCINFIRTKAQHHWPEILEALNIERRFLKNSHGPCPVCGGKDRFRFDDQSRGTFFCNQCRSGDGIKLLQLVHGWSLPYTLTMIAKQFGLYNHESGLSNTKKASDHIDKILPTTPVLNEEITKRKRNLNLLLRQSKPVSVGDPVDLYLKTRGIELDTFPDALRFHEALSYYDKDGKLIGQFPAMLGLIMDNVGCLVSVLRTYLTFNGQKAEVPSPKKVMQPIFHGATAGASIRLFEPFNGVLAISEGIETSLAFHMATDIPVWAAVSASGLENIILPAAVNHVYILVDNDKSGTGQKAAKKLSSRLLSEGRKVIRLMPEIEGSDFADELLRGVK